MATKAPKSPTKSRTQQPKPVPGPHRMTPAMHEHVRQMMESPGFNNPTMRMVYQELELVTAERDAALGRLGEGER